MVADVLVTQGARASAAMIFDQVKLRWLDPRTLRVNINEKRNTADSQDIAMHYKI